MIDRTRRRIAAAGEIVARPGSLSLGDRADIARELSAAQADLARLQQDATRERPWLRAELLARQSFLERLKHLIGDF